MNCPPTLHYLGEIHNSMKFPLLIVIENVDVTGNVVHCIST
jgi:hypothetical protein